MSCWCEKNTQRAKAAAAVKAQVQDLQEAHQWVSKVAHQQASARGAADSAATQVSACQLSEIAETIAEMQSAESQQVKEVKTMLNTTDMEATCYATEDIHVPAGQRLEKAVTAAIDMPLDQLHCAMIFEAEGIPSIAMADSDYSRSESDGSNAPELLSESESESYSSDEDESEESNQG